MIILDINSEKSVMKRNLQVKITNAMMNSLNVVGHGHLRRHRIQGMLLAEIYQSSVRIKVTLFLNTNARYLRMDNAMNVIRVSVLGAIRMTILLDGSHQRNNADADLRRLTLRSDINAPIIIRASAERIVLHVTGHGQLMTLQEQLQRKLTAVALFLI